MTRYVHLVGSVALDTAQDVFATAGKLLGPHLKRVPDGEPGGRRLWISWQVPVLRANPGLQVVSRPAAGGYSLGRLRRGGMQCGSATPGRWSDPGTVAFW